MSLPVHAVSLKVETSVEDLRDWGCQVWVVDSKTGLGGVFTLRLFGALGRSTVLGKTQKFNPPLKHAHDENFKKLKLQNVQDRRFLFYFESPAGPSAAIAPVDFVTTCRENLYSESNVDERHRVLDPFEDVLAR